MNDTFPMDDVDFGIEIRDVYDGVSIWIMKDRTAVNRWRGFGGRREALTDEYIQTAGFQERLIEQAT